MQSQSEPVMGLRVEGSELKPELILIDSSFIKCPIAHAAGIPLYVKRILNAKKIQSDFYWIVRMMSQPSIGLAPNDWQYGGALGPAPPVLVVRSDSIQFGINDWSILDDFEVAMLDDGPKKVTRKDFIQFAKCQHFSEANIVLEVNYPKGTKCLIDGLTQKAELNGKIGICNGSYKNHRIGVQFEGVEGKYAIRSKNLKIVEKVKQI